MSCVATTRSYNFKCFRGWWFEKGKKEATNSVAMSGVEGQQGSMYEIPENSPTGENNHGTSDAYACPEHVYMNETAARQQNYEVYEMVN